MVEPMDMLRAVLESSPEGWLIFDSSINLLGVNSAAKRRLEGIGLACREDEAGIPDCLLAEIRRHYGATELGKAAPPMVRAILQGSRSRQDVHLTYHSGERGRPGLIVVRVIDPVVGPAFDGLPAPDLSARERDVVEIVLMGCSNAEIAGRLKVTQATVKSHLRRIFRKFRVRTRSQLLALAAFVRWRAQPRRPTSPRAV